MQCVVARLQAVLKWLFKLFGASMEAHGLLGIDGEVSVAELEHRLFDDNEAHGPRRRTNFVSYDEAGDFVTLGQGQQAITGEQKLVRQLLEDALRDAALPPSEMRDGARDWLRDDGERLNGLYYMARDCFEALYIDYDAAMKALEIQWKLWDSGKAPRPVRTRHNARRRQS